MFCNIGQAEIYKTCKTSGRIMSILVELYQKSRTKRSNLKKYAGPADFFPRKNQKSSIYVENDSPQTVPGIDQAVPFLFFPSTMTLSVILQGYND